MSHRRIAAALVFALVSAGCESTSVASPEPELAVRANFINGPGELPYVLRFESRVIAGWVDLRRNTAVIIGAPLNPAESRICGGTVRNQFMPMQLVGDFEGVIKQILQSQDANVFVYDEIAPSLEDALCGSEPAGVGQGFYMRTDNDLLGTGGNRANGFSEHVHATVDLTGGGTGTVTGTLHGVGLKGSLFFVKTSVIFNTAGNQND